MKSQDKRGKNYQYLMRMEEKITAMAEAVYKLQQAVEKAVNTADKVSLFKELHGEEKPFAFTFSASHIPWECYAPSPNSFLMPDPYLQYQEDKVEALKTEFNKKLSTTGHKK